MYDLPGGEVGHPLGDLEGEGGQVPRGQAGALAVQVAVVVLGPVAAEEVLEIGV